MKFLYHVEFNNYDSYYENSEIQFVNAKNEDEFYNHLINDPFKYGLCEEDDGKNYISLNCMEPNLKLQCEKLSKEDLVKTFIKIFKPQDLKDIIMKNNISARKCLYNVYYHILEIPDN